jgi:cytochrome c-type biogenesis protein CcmH/NrfF
MTLTLWILAAVLLVLLVLGLLSSVRRSRAAGPRAPHTPPRNTQDDSRYARHDFLDGDGGGSL